MKAIIKLVKGFSILIISILLNSKIDAQDLNIYETINYINSKLDNSPCRSFTGYSKYKITWSSDGYLTIQQNPNYTDIVAQDVENNIIKAKGRSLNFDRIEVKNYNSNNSFIEIPCFGISSYQPANCITETNVPSGNVRNLGILNICFSADYETQRGLLNAFKHLGSLIKAEDSQIKNTDPFSDENYNKNKTTSNTLPNKNVTAASSIKKENTQSDSRSINTQPAWIEKKGEVGNFYISFPRQPTYTQGSFHGWKASDKEGQVFYLLAYLEAPSSGQMSVKVAENYLLPSMFEGDVQISKNYVTYNGFNALDFLYKTTNNPIMYKQGRVVVKGQKVYILQVQYYHKDLIYFDKFTKSLRFY